MSGLAMDARLATRSQLSLATVARSPVRLSQRVGRAWRGASATPGLQPSKAQSLSWRESRQASLPLAASPTRHTRRGRWAVGAAKGEGAEGAGAEGAGAAGGESSTALTPMEVERRPDNWVSPAVLQEMGEEERTPIQKWLNPSQDELPDDVPMSIWDHLEELRERVLVSVGAVGGAILLCFFYSKDLVVFLEAPVYAQGVRFLQLSPGEYFFTTLKVAGYCGLLLGGPVILYEIIAFVIPGLTASERRFLAPIVFGSSILFYSGIAFSYTVLTPAALNFFISYAEGVVESLWSIDQYFEFVLLLMFSTGLSFQVPVIQLLLGQLGLVTADQMLGIWRYVVVGGVTAAAVLTPSTDPLTQCLLAGPLIGLYMGGAYLVKLLEGSKNPA
ncbi:hypothetical protein CLOM_g6861 [Closterium sp. NIES-68]|nr:hypothetical protein CLOM_g6861 [Closterium sp. NIES-68]GJP61464.1 hypothetical protein CLOP_g18620 [Closterium sp. NIES-67]